ncbi:glycosyltransferase family 39 protein [Bacillus cereus]|nr:glycosyltransferase family 39 protein [Bacillus cereus]
MFIKNAAGRFYTTLVLTTFFIIFSIIAIKFFIPKTIWMVWDFPYPTEYYTPKKVFIVIVTALILFSLFFMYYKFVISKLNLMYTNVAITGYVLIILASELFITSIAFNSVVGDYAIIKEGIVSFFAGDSKFLEMGQLRFYPYNTHIVLIGGYFAKLLGSVDLSVKVLPILSITGSIILNTLTVKKVTNFKAAHISIVLAVLNVLIYWQAPVFYTHTLVVFFISATMYAYLCLKTADTKRKKIVWWGVLGIVAACTYVIRPTALAVAIAILFENIFKYRKAYSFKVLSSVMFCILLIAGFKGVTTKFNLSTDNDIEKIPYSHWVKMGLNEQTYGVWNQSDVNYISDMHSTKEMDEHNKKIIVQRLKELGFTGYMSHLNEKIEREWVSSQFSMYRIGEWFEQKNDKITNIVSNYKTTSYKVFNLYTFIIKLLILLSTLAVVILYKKLNEKEAEVLRISLASTLIIFVFLLLWETAPHYTYEAWAFMNIPAALGLHKVFTIFCDKNKSV